ncbi:MAG: hypothetical protein JWN95_2355 [Frankiales bacterium]|nr:hypothetical protein [Frankiales bacterium]
MIENAGEPSAASSEPLLQLILIGATSQHCNMSFRQIRPDTGDVVTEGACFDNDSLRSVDVICRTCGPRTFLLCGLDFGAVMDSFDNARSTTYCTTIELRHEVVALAGA